MNRITYDDKTIHLDFATEQIWIGDIAEPDRPCVTLIGTDADGTEYELLYNTTESYRTMANKMLADKKPTPRLTRLMLDLYEQLTHSPYCDWRKPLYCRAI